MSRWSNADQIFYSCYAHLSTVKVGEDEEVTAGKIIGKSTGNTGAFNGSTYIFQDSTDTNRRIQVKPYLLIRGGRRSL